MPGLMIRASAAVSALLLAAMPAAGSVSDYVYKVLTPADGYPSRPTSIVVEDYGFAWASSEYGLCRIGKDDVKTFRGLDGFPSDNIHTLELDAEGNLWILTDKGICAIRACEDDVRMDFIPGIDPSAIAYSVVSTPSAVYFGGIGVLWKYEYSTRLFTLAARIGQDPEFRIDNMCMSGIGQILLSDRNDSSTYSYFIKSGKVEQTSPGHAPWGEDDYACFVDSQYRLWISSYNKGISVYDLSGHLLRTYDTSNSDLSSNIVLCFLEKDGLIWAGTDGGGISIINPSDGSVAVLKQDPDALHPFPANTIRTLYCDAGGCVWAGRSTGGIILINEPQIKSWRTDNIHPRINSEGISCLSAGIAGDPVWIGTSGTGLLSFDRKTETFRSYPSTSGMAITAIANDGDDKLLLACPTSGLLVFDKKEGRITGTVPVSEQQKQLLFEELDLCMDNDGLGNIIIIADRIYRFGPAVRSLEEYPIPRQDAFRDMRIVWQSGCTFYHDRKNIYRWNENLEEKLELIYTIDGDGDIRSACMGPGGVIWLALDNQYIVCYEVATGDAHFLYLTGSSPKRSIACDAKGRVVIGTTNNLEIYTPEEKTAVYPDEMDGSLAGEYSTHAKCISSDGYLFMGGTGGLVCLSPDTRFTMTRTPKVVMAEVKLDSRVIGDFSSLVVPYDFNDLFLRFFVRDRDAVRHRPCYFILEGRKSTARFDPELPQLALHGLAPGPYRVLASVRMSDGRRSEFAEVFSFRVGSPWYASWWFFTILFILLAGILSIVKVMLARRERRNLEKLSSQERLDFLVNVSHELRTPLTLVMGPLSRIIERMPDTDGNKSRLSRIYVQADRMKTLLNTVLTTNKIRQGAFPMQMAPTDLAGWIDGQVDKYRDEAMGRNMTIAVHHQDGPVSVRMDDASCCIVFANMMMNALKHNDEGCQIMVRSEVHATDGMVRVSVVDRGPGFGDEDPDMLFSRYYRADADSSGFGIGLAYAKDIVTGHGGRIGAFNNPDGAGATFWFELPLCDRDVPEPVAGDRPSAMPEDAPSCPRRDGTDLSDKTVLFVDDDPDLREYMLEELSSQFGRALAASNGREALRLIGQGGIHIVVADVIMPEMDGLELCRAMKSDPSMQHIPVILLAASTDDGSADAYIPKPFKPEALIDAARILL